MTEAADPCRNVVVQASAGTGKTWLLVTRLVRLLLSGAAPESILAITFTRKAAAEMQARLRERLFGYLTLDDRALDEALRALGIEPGNPAGAASWRRRARLLYETLLHSDGAVRVTTFHAFCQDILRRFPFDAGVPPGFELVESEGLLMDEAWEALLGEATRHPDGATAAALRVLLDYHGNTEGPRETLRIFLHHRIDWWAYTLGASDPAAHATALLQQRLDIAPGASPPPADFFSPARREELAAFARLLDRHPTATNAGHRDRIHAALAAVEATASSSAPDFDGALSRLEPVFFKKDGTPRERKESATLARKLGEADMRRFLELDRVLTRALARTREEMRRHRTLALNRAWYRAGQRLLEHYARLKTERRLLDFADLEWQTCLLLRHGDNAAWIQYKLDRAIDHILVDEFQDTSPTQWGMLQPLLEELAAGDPERRRSVFLVGDVKQSIYRFRRADPRLFHTAGQWLRERAGAVDCDLNLSWRSAPAVVEFVNRVFTSPPLDRDLAPFPRHETHRRTCWGRVELLPLIDIASTADAGTPAAAGPYETGLRDPLTTPRPAADESPHFREGQAIAARIRAIVASGTRLDDGTPAGYDDVMILVRTRAPVHHYERALREAGIPYLGGGRSTLLDCLEIQDMVALLETLITPYDNLALATALRSPVFACDDEDLVRLARQARRAGQPWFHALQDLAAATAPAATSHGEETTEDALPRAACLLARWHALADRIPVHDLLDRIYSEGNVLARYAAGFPPHLRARARANLMRFIELALAVDSGRYPSLPGFLSRLRDLQRLDQEALEEAPLATRGGGVRIMTIHAAKGLEAPIVILADSARADRRRASPGLLLDWPPDAHRPRAFLLGGRRNEADAFTRELLEAQSEAEQREEARLLYVALTRARQWLLISGCADRRGRWGGWYRSLVQALGGSEAERETLVREGGSWEKGEQPARKTAGGPRSATGSEPGSEPGSELGSELASELGSGLGDPRLGRPVAVSGVAGEITPSAAAADGDSEGGDGEGRQRGIVIHRMLERLGDLPRAALTEQAALDTLRDAIAREFHYDPGDPRFLDWWAEALAVRRAPHLAMIFDPDRYRRAWNEQPLIYHERPHEREGNLVNGVVDRLVLRDGEVLVVDYKTHRQARKIHGQRELAALAAPYAAQMRLYRAGARRLWPGLRVRALLLFTACAAIHEFDLDPQDRDDARDSP